MRSSPIYETSFSSFFSRKNSKPEFCAQDITNIAFKPRLSTIKSPPFSTPIRKQTIISSYSPIAYESLKENIPINQNFKMISPKSSYNKQDKKILFSKTKEKINNNFSNSKIKNETALISRIQIFSNDFIDDTKRFINQKLNSISQRQKCACEGGISQNATCNNAKKWLLKRYKLSELNYLKNTYETMKNDEKLSEKMVVNQIGKDIERTFPFMPYFQGEGREILRNILETLAKYDPQVGYVQGMNFIAGFFLYHAEEYIAFWLIVMIFETAELRDVYLPELPGLSKHLQIIELTILNHLPDLHIHLNKEFIRTEMYCCPWIFSLFGVLLCLDDLFIFFQNFLEFGWCYFYKFIIAFLEEEKGKLMENEGAEIITFLSENNYRNKKSKDFWKEILRKALKIELSSTFVSKLHSNYDNDKKIFKLILKK